MNAGREAIGESNKAECTSVHNTEIEDLQTNQHTGRFKATKKLERLKNIVNLNESGKGDHITIDIVETEGLQNQRNPLESQGECSSIDHGSSSTAPPVVKTPNDSIDPEEKARLLNPECDMDDFSGIPETRLPRQVRTNGCIEWAKKDPASCCISHTMAAASMVCFVLLAVMAVIKTSFRY
ncbi:uncharacterized protein PGTG_20278 [Puccinia graminis f. sp. tritici CRL 75-36-700-3]|uniref:Uncharacterized protein n=1 Tax=Puccinia graminis f. sp. tritici (strain CRL 75-36-700-3 / race SCCL) TaxID=418459 RepID=E3NXM5_PUCGT|nr:uncharacterized protein PGTG_20278 [Puccinia graminis f. sp. tritici CRL 75-36-700-3]EFP94324.2 hypothetical protein PGTG_20278 [Puccinia graminis f. sp. tritici CRL 75-36-700-3]